jgi:hypothetical protein
MLIATKITKKRHEVHDAFFAQNASWPSACFVFFVVERQR